MSSRQATFKTWILIRQCAECKFPFLRVLAATQAVAWHDINQLPIAMGEVTQGYVTKGGNP